MMKNNFQKGFTLIELMTSLTIFALVITVSLGAILSIFNNNRKGRALRAAMTNINQAIESVSREIRYGSNYHCGSTGSVTVPQNCSGATGDNFISFLSSDNIQISYRMNGAVFEKQNGTGGDWLPVLSPEVTIDSILFFVTGAASGDGVQPSIIMKMTGYAGTGTGRTDLSLQTYVTQRTLDN